VRRLTTGVVWNYVLQRLTGDNVSYQCNDIGGFRPTPVPIIGVPPYLQAELYDPEDPARPIIERYLKSQGLGPMAPAVAAPVGFLDGTIFVDARGFNTWWFTGLFAAAKSQLEGLLNDRYAIQSNIDYSLAVDSSNNQFPANLHLPMLATMQGPAARDLMALGWMADRILSAY
jgi:hypothetical protein